MATFTLTCIGDDRPGLVSDLSAPIHAHGGSWNRGQMARLGGKFAGILLVEVADPQADALVAALAGLEAVGLTVLVERTDVPPHDLPARLDLALLGADRPGIVAEVSAALASHGVGIRELVTDVREAPMAGGRLFEARARLDAPSTVDVDALRSVLEAIADDLLVEIDLSELEEESPS